MVYSNFKDREKKLWYNNVFSHVSWQKRALKSHYLQCACLLNCATSVFLIQPVGPPGLTGSTTYGHPRLVLSRDGCDIDLKIVASSSSNFLWWVLRRILWKHVLKSSTCRDVLPNSSLKQLQVLCWSCSWSWSQKAGFTSEVEPCQTLNRWSTLTLMIEKKNLV